MSGTPLIVLSTYVFALLFHFEYCIVSLRDFFLDQNTRRESGRKVQLGNVEAAKVSNKTRKLYFVVNPIIIVSFLAHACHIFLLLSGNCLQSAP